MNRPISERPQWLCKSLVNTVAVSTDLWPLGNSAAPGSASHPGNDAYRVREHLTEAEIDKLPAALKRKAKEPPSGPGWIYEIKHDGFRILARKDGNQVKLITRNGYDFADRYPLIVDGIASLPVETCIIDGEAIVVDQNGLSVFNLLRYRQHDHAATLCAFDLLERDRSFPVKGDD